MSTALPRPMTDPPRAASLMPFWFWNDALDADAVVRSIDDFQAHGVHGFVIHPRVGLPRSLGWMSDALLDLMGVAIDAARARDMRVILYDEGMYPSGSSSGQVVARDPSLAARCLALHDAARPLPSGAVRVLRVDHRGRAWDVVDRVADSYVRGLHYVGDGPAEDEPPAGDILDPRTAHAVIDLVYARYAARFGGDFGRTVLGVFTDEPNPLGKCREADVWPGSRAALDEIARREGHDRARIDLPGLFFDDWPDARAIRAAHRAWVRRLLEETWYAPLSRWCARHGLWLMGHPDAGDEIGAQRHFHVPGQDLVWRLVEPGTPSALVGPESTQAKCTSSAKRRHGRPRNSNEFAGAYGHATSFDEVRWLARWCCVRGVDLLIPHAFYHSVRGPRVDERPPQLGPHTPQWGDGTFAAFADECRRLCALNGVGEPVCDVAILTHGDRCPWRAAKVCFEHQVDFDYLEPDALLDAATRIDADGIALATAHYRLLIVDAADDSARERGVGDARRGSSDDALASRLAALSAAGGVLRFEGDAGALLRAVEARGASRPRIEPPAADLRVRRLRVANDEVFMLFNEGNAPLRTTLSLSASPSLPGGARGLLVDPATNATRPQREPFVIDLAPWSLRLLVVPREAIAPRATEPA